MKLRMSSFTPAWNWLLYIAVAPLAVASSARGELTVIENADGQQGLTVFKMTVTPAPAPVPVLKYRLVPGVLEMRPGNAALYYLRAVTENGVKILGHLNVAGRVAATASSLYARNLFAFLETLVDKETKTIAPKWDDELVKATLLTRDGLIAHPSFQAVT